jgi:hypothetical protein
MIAREMPKYKSHKVVWALKIKSIAKELAEYREIDGSATITPEEEGYEPFKVSSEYMNKHQPEVSGYYVVYEDGYKSFSPADAFEKGNTLIKETTFLDRLIIEEKELGEKIIGLNAGLNQPGFSEKVGDYQFELLALQHSTMIAYRRVLNMRIKDIYQKMS